MARLFCFQKKNAKILHNGADVLVNADLLGRIFSGFQPKIKSAKLTVP